MTARFCGIWILSPLINYNDMKHKKRCQSQNFLDPRLLREKERESEKERERAYAARETFSHNFDFYVVQTVERGNWANKWQ